MKNPFFSLCLDYLDASQNFAKFLYIKKILLHHNKQVFGKSADDPSLIPQTVHGIMLVSLPKVIQNFLPDWLQFQN